MTETMRAMVYRKYGSPERLALETMPRPTAGRDQVLVRVVASSVNPVDWKMASGAIRIYMPATFPCVPGFDLAGEVVELGPGVTDFAPGARVHARIAKPGAAAEYAVADVAQTTAMPEGMSFEVAAALPLAGQTALQGLRDRGGLPMTHATQRVLVVGASGGVGHLAVQIAAAAGADVTGVCSTRNVNFVSRIGATTVIDYTRPDPYRNVDPFDLVYDCVAGDPAPYIRLVKPGGRYASCMPGVKTFLRSFINPLSRRKVFPVMLKGNAADLKFLDELFTAKKLKPAIDASATLEELPAAWKRSMTGRATGKIIIEVA